MDFNYSISVGSTQLSRVYNYQYLGVELDDTLSYDKFLDSVVNKTNQKLVIFRKICRYLSKKTAITVYKQMILPSLEYCNILFNSGKRFKLDKLQSKYVCIIENRHDVSLRLKETILCSNYGLETLQSGRDVYLAFTICDLLCDLGAT